MFHQSHSARFATKAIGIFLGTFFILGMIPVAALAQGGGPSGSFNYPMFEDTPVRNAVGNILRLADRDVGGLGILVVALLAIFCLVREKRRLGYSLSGMTFLFFAVRLFAGAFFGEHTTYCE